MVFAFIIIVIIYAIPDSAEASPSQEADVTLCSSSLKTFSGVHNYINEKELNASIKHQRYCMEQLAMVAQKSVKILPISEHSQHESGLFPVAKVGYNTMHTDANNYMLCKNNNVKFQFSSVFAPSLISSLPVPDSTAFRAVWYARHH